MSTLRREAGLSDPYGNREWVLYSVLFVVSEVRQFKTPEEPLAKSQLSSSVSISSSTSGETGSKSLEIASKC